MVSFLNHIITVQAGYKCQAPITSPFLSRLKKKKKKGKKDIGILSAFKPFSPSFRVSFLIPEMNLMNYFSSLLPTDWAGQLITPDKIVFFSISFFCFSLLLCSFDLEFCDA